MITTLMMLASLTTPPLMELPEGFKAQCKSVSEAYAYLLAAPTKDGRLLKDILPDGGSRIDLLKMGGQFTIDTTGADLIVRAQNGPNWKIVVLKEQLGNLVILVSTSTFGASTTIYHLRYQNHIGAMTVSRVSYYGTGDIDDTSLEDFHCTTTL
ncbi:hypothetical protein [Rhodanobacter sp. MP7CTX1]|uniref:hypothetical protein n=1 Tax=Rhodanobacter sp. MP7CTX1 TaxID=2723084 RepID=UPI00161EE367|nr:hypothetical protein [Rhodanobacter sp. MP7CTX1]MBB6186454.1 hypothetical protein [Rhodanobacter sp. MP7CTX1]